MKRKWLLLLLTAPLFFACKKKKDDNCWICATTVNTRNVNSNGAGSSKTTATEMCDQTEEQVRQYERDNTGTTTTMQGNATFEINMSTTCTKE